LLTSIATFLSTTTSFKLLETLVRPSVHPLARRLRLSVSVLLSGGRGIGKTSLVAAVASSLGLHFLPVRHIFVALLVTIS
jgi:SpoVK/Ycf46/Vps4 family AAA+-type ATPase